MIRTSLSSAYFRQGRYVSKPIIAYYHSIYRNFNYSQIKGGYLMSQAGGYGGLWTSTGTILVLFILLVIVSRTILY
ncbi:hypothetical protein D3C73_883550 [compost metagenome]